ncbi:hypothetical protein C8A01DRAFT_18158 [Parachaetomium inaequale]|uniref:Uncharacterized protein n=1 Tax=Parachaetomium inaequale TaxID=2588326 RepID=A0AAN6PB68_9PEZI|nr:hypothetical protein C8A01DRAFT_18158 [Parachaetomium inaequale]
MVWPFTFFQGTRSSHNSAENPIAELQRKAAEYERNIGELVAENYQLQHRAADCERKIGEVGAENCKLQRKAGDYERKVKELQAENYKLQRRAADCERKIGELGAENCKLQRKDAERKEQMQLQTTRFAAELKAIRNKDFVNIPNLSDAAVQGNWRTLCFSVRQFVSIHLPESLDLSTIEALAGSEAFSWLPNASKTLQAPLFCPILLESWVWHFLCIRIFDPSSTYWAGEEGKTWAILCGGFRDRLSDSGRSHPSASTIAEFHDWRVRSAHFVSKLDKRNPDNMVKAETTNLLKLLEAVTNDREGTGDMYRDAHGIIRQATELDQFFRLARADFHVFITRVKLPLVHPPNLGFQFDPETMERAKVIPVAGQHAGAAVVDLAISPGLIKAGNCDGSNYHHERVLVKLQALCDLQPTLRFLEERRMSVEEGGRH